MQKPRAAERLQLCSALLEKAAILCKRLRVEQPEKPQPGEYMPIEVIEERLETIDKDTSGVVKREDALDEEIPEDLLQGEHVRGDLCDA